METVCTRKIKKSLLILFIPLAFLIQRLLTLVPHSLTELLIIDRMMTSQTRDNDCNIYVYKINNLSTYHLENNYSSSLYAPWGQQLLPHFIYNSLLIHPLKTNNPNNASLFYIPSFDLPCVNRDRNCIEKFFDVYNLIINENTIRIKIRNNISNHFTVLWRPNKAYNSNFYRQYRSQPFMKSTNVTKLTVENFLDKKDWVTIPYLSSYIDQPIVKINDNYDIDRKWFISGFFESRSLHMSSGKLRFALKEQCFNYSDNVCNLHTNNSDGDYHNQQFMDIYCNSIFTLQPTGDSYSRKAVIDSLNCGSIPIIFNKKSFKLNSLFQIDYIRYPLYVLIDGNSVINGTMNVIEYVRGISNQQIKMYQNNIAKYIDRLRYYDYRYRNLNNVARNNDALDWILQYLCDNTKDVHL